MKRPRPIILAVIAVLAGCRTPMEMDANPMVSPPALVTLEDTKETKDSPAQAYPSVTIPMPVFPRDLWVSGIEGTVVVRLTIGKDGLVKNAVATQSSMKEFEGPA